MVRTRQHGTAKEAVDTNDEVVDDPPAFDANDNSYSGLVGRTDNDGAKTAQLRQRRGRRKLNEVADYQGAMGEDNADVDEDEDYSDPDPTNTIHDVSNDVDDVEDNVDDKDEELTRSGKRRRRSSEAPKGRGPEESRTCPHCGKVIVSIHGLKYHVDNYVCRKGEQPDHQVNTKKPPKKRKQSAMMGRPKPTQSKRFRGSKDERTCPTCKKEFTSTLGRDYHVKHSVCKEQSMSNIAGTIAFPILMKGTKFVTRFGIVEVVADDRAMHTFTYPNDIRAESKAYNSHRDKQAVQKRKVYLNYGFQSRLRRRRLRRMYEYDNVRSDTTRNAYFGGTAATVTDAKGNPADPTHRQDPMFPPEAFPDRIVVGRLIPDRRQRFYSLEQHQNQGDDVVSPTASVFGCTLFLRRREFNKTYSPNVCVYICPDCGTEYASKEGFSYHVQSTVCKKKALARAAQRTEMNTIIQERVDRHLMKSSSKAQRTQRKRKEYMSIYPQVWLSLGFALPAVVTAPNVTEKGDAIKFENRVKEIDKTLNDLREEIRKQTIMNNDRKEGAMYSSVFKALEFKKPQPPKKTRAPNVESVKSKPGKKSGTGRRQRNGDLLEDDAGDDDDDDDADDDPSPEVPVVDIQVLIDEAKSGRYPSIQRYDGDYPDDCVICKDGGRLFLCDFCCNAVHLKCILTKIIIKDPEPEEDFMCHVCAKKIVSRRARAEKRRLQKQEMMLDKARQKAADRAAAEGRDDQKHESDYHAAAAVGQELSELIELLGDARRSLHQMVEVSKINRLRRLQLGL